MTIRAVDLGTRPTKRDRRCYDPAVKSNILAWFAGELVQVGDKRTP
jgi:hypothetical protein